MDPIRPISGAASDVFVNRTEVSDRVHRRRQREDEEHPQRQRQHREDAQEQSPVAVPSPDSDEQPVIYDDHGRAPQPSITRPPRHFDATA